MDIRVAGSEDFIRVRDFYHSLIDEMKDAQYKPGWEKDVYPAPEFLQKSIRSGELYIAQVDGHTAACMVVNHEYNDGYQDIPWSVDAEASELLVIHALGVHPLFSGKGLAKQMVQKVIDLARESNMKTIRLDVLNGNIPAEQTYTKMGFSYRGTIKMFYEDTGWTDYRLFEYLVSQPAPGC